MFIAKKIIQQKKERKTKTSIVSFPLCSADVSDGECVNYCQCKYFVMHFFWIMRTERSFIWMKRENNGWTHSSLIKWSLMWNEGMCLNKHQVLRSVQGFANIKPCGNPFSKHVSINHSHCNLHCSLFLNGRKVENKVIII